MMLTQQNNAVTVSASAVNAEHALAQSHAEQAIKHAIRCGELLQAKKAELPHGEFGAWIAANCTFKRSTAARYMKAAQSSTAVEISSLSHLFPSGRQRREAKKPASLESYFGPTVIPMVHAFMTVGSIDDEPVMLLQESRLNPGYWHSRDFRDGTISGRPCRPEGLSYILTRSPDLARVVWFLAPDDGELMRDEVPYNWRDYAQQVEA
jgi:hypothetical protein